MRKRMAALALLVGLVIAGRAGAAELTLVRGGAALATYQQTSADGCIAIHGEIAVVEATRGGELANGLYVTAIREDLCTPDNGNGYAGFAEGSFHVVGLQLGHFAGTAVIPSYSGAAPLTFELDLWWLGSGKVTRTNDVFRDGGTISFSWKGTRNALTFGKLHIDGAPATVTSSSLASETSGTLAR